MTDDRVTPVTDHRLTGLLDMLNEAINSRLLTPEQKVFECYRWVDLYRPAYEAWLLDGTEEERP